MGTLIIKVAAYGAREILKSYTQTIACPKNMDWPYFFETHDRLICHENENIDMEFMSFQQDGQVTIHSMQR